MESPIGPSRPNRRQILWGALLSLLLPGLGQAYARRLRAAACFALASFALSAAFALQAYLADPATITRQELVGFAALAVLTLVLNLGAATHAWLSLSRPGAWQRRRRPGWLGSTRAWGVALVALTAATDLATGDLGWLAFQVPSASMHPTLLEGDRFLAAGSEVARAGLAPGDVIVFRLPRDPSVHYVKRLIAMPGQTVQMREGHLFIDGAEVPHADLGPADPNTRRWQMTLPNGRHYVALKHPDMIHPLDNTPPFRLGPDRLFVMGDNLDDSLDSRAPQGVGPVPRDLVEGRASVVFWSPNLRRIGTLVR